jgi:hypothetical protein
MDTILNNTPGENYFDTRALADFVFVCLHRCQQFSGTIVGEMVAVIHRTRFVPVSFIFYL